MRHIGSVMSDLALGIGLQVLPVFIVLWIWRAKAALMLLPSVLALVVWIANRLISDDVQIFKLGNSNYHLYWNIFSVLFVVFIILYCWYLHSQNLTWKAVLGGQTIQVVSWIVVWFFLASILFGGKHPS